MTDALTLINQMREQSPHAVDLARLVSFAVLVEPALLREMRLSLLPRVDVSAEADFWFGPLVQTRSREGVVLFPAVAEMLRMKLRSKQAEECWRITERLHDYLPPAIKLEEKLNWLSMKPQDNDLAISGLFQQALAALLDQNASDVANWAGRALPRMSAALRTSDGAVMLAAASDLRLGRPWKLAEHLHGGHIPNWFVDVLPKDLANVELGITATSSEIVFDPTPAQDSQRIRLPATDPRVIQISSKGQSQIEFIDAGASRAVPVLFDDGPVILTTIDGKAFTLNLDRTSTQRIQFSNVKFFTLDVLRARKGDCLMLHFGSEQDPHLILIDGGPSGVYHSFLKPRLQKIHETRGLDEQEPLPVDVVMVSHVDDDHIKGILDLTKEQRTTSPDVRLDVTSLWHNSLDDLLKTKSDELVAGFRAASVTETAAQGETGIDSGSVLASFGAAMRADDTEIEDEDMHQTIEVLSSIPQGRTLRDDARALGWKPNHKFKGKLILAARAARPVTLGDLKVTVVGPMQPELEALQERHDEWLRTQKEKKKKSPEVALAAFADESVLNLSSIVVLAELEGKSMLLTGDARGDKILEGMELAGLLEKGGQKHVDLLKVPHHGSDNNMETIFFKRVPADHYVFSGDGEHGNPERATLQMLLDARGADADYTIHLTYPVAEIDAGRKAEWEEKQAQEKARKKKNPASKKEVRPDWSPEEHGLVAFFKNNPKMAAKLSIVDEDKPHLINLLTPLKL